MTAWFHYSSGVGDSKESINPAHFLTDPECILSSTTADVDDKTFWWHQKVEKSPPKSAKKGMTFPVPSFPLTLSYSQQYRWVESTPKTIVTNKRQMRHCGINSRNSDLLGSSWFPGNLRPEITCIFHSYEWVTSCCWTCCSVSVLMGCQKSLSPPWNDKMLTWMMLSCFCWGISV